MRIPFLSMFMTSPFVGLQEHAEKVKECAWTFQQAIECHFSKECVRFEEFRQEVRDALAALNGGGAPAHRWRKDSHPLAARCGDGISEPLPSERPDAARLLQSRVAIYSGP